MDDGGDETAVLNLGPRANIGSKRLPWPDFLLSVVRLDHSFSGVVEFKHDTKLVIKSKEEFRKKMEENHPYRSSDINTVKKSMKTKGWDCSKCSGSGEYTFELRTTGSRGRGQSNKRRRVSAPGHVTASPEPEPVGPSPVTWSRAT